MDAPDAIKSLTADCLRQVREALDFELDFTPETLPFVDHYCSIVPREAEEIEQTSRLVGAYFGEVIRRRYPCRWHLTTEGTLEWRIEFDQCFLYFNPVGVALELLFQGEVPESNASYVTWPDMTDDLAERLDRAPVSEEDYYKLTVRLEVLDTVVDFLMARRGEDAPERYDEAFYERKFASG